MARQLSEQLEREVSADELLKSQTKTGLGENLPNSGAAFDTSYTPAIAPATSPVLPPVDATAKHRRPRARPNPCMDGMRPRPRPRHACVGSPVNEPAPNTKPSHE